MNDCARESAQILDADRTGAMSPSGGEAIARVMQAHGVGPVCGMAGLQLPPAADSRTLEVETGDRPA